MRYLPLLLLADEQKDMIDSPLTIPFYECGVQLTDMVYLQRKMIQ